MRHSSSLRHTIRRALAIGAVVAATTTFAACSTTSASPDPTGSEGSQPAVEPTTVRLAFTPGTASLNVHVAQELGFFEKHGLDVQITEGLDLPTWITALGSQYDIALTTAGIFASGAEKFDLAAVAGGSINGPDTPQNVLIARGDAIKDAGDLAGKRVGVSTITGTTPLSIQYLVDQAGGDPASVTFTQVASNLQADQLKAGQVDAVVSLPPSQLVVLEDPENHVVLDNVQYAALSKIDPGQKTTALAFFASSRSWAEENPQAVKAFRDALDEGLQWILDNDADARDMLVDWLKVDQKIADGAEFEGVMDAHITADQLRPIFELSVDRGVLPEDQVAGLLERVAQ